MVFRLDLGTFIHGYGARDHKDTANEARRAGDAPGSMCDWLGKPPAWENSAVGAERQTPDAERMPCARGVG